MTRPVDVEGLRATLAKRGGRDIAISDRQVQQIAALLDELTRLRERCQLCDVAMCEKDAAEEDVASLNECLERQGHWRGEVVGHVAALVRLTAPAGWRKHGPQDEPGNDCVRRDDVVTVALRIKSALRSELAGGEVKADDAANPYEPNHTKRCNDVLTVDGSVALFDVCNRTRGHEGNHMRLSYSGVAITTWDAGTDAKGGG